MKKILLTTAVVTIGSLFISANAGNLYDKTGKEARKQIRKERQLERKELWLHSASPLTETQFFTDFPDAKNVNWKESDFTEASFLDGTVQKTAYYDMDNELVGVSTHVDISALPEKAQQKINKKYPGYTVKEVVLFDDNEANDTNMYLFSTSFADQDNYFPVLTKGSKEIILKVSMDGAVSFFHKVK
jgi:hypothetical protein